MRAVKIIKTIFIFFVVTNFIYAKNYISEDIRNKLIDIYHLTSDVNNIEAIHKEAKECLEKITKQYDDKMAEHIKTDMTLLISELENISKETDIVKIKDMAYNLLQLIKKINNR